jgi:hypothetical protein
MGLMLFAYGKEEEMLKKNLMDVRETIRSINAHGRTTYKRVWLLRGTAYNGCGL